MNSSWFCLIFISSRGKFPSYNYMININAVFFFVGRYLCISICSCCFNIIFKFDGIDRAFVSLVTFWLLFITLSIMSSSIRIKFPVLISYICMHNLRCRAHIRSVYVLTSAIETSYVDAMYMFYKSSSFL